MNAVLKIRKRLKTPRTGASDGGAGSPVTALLVIFAVGLVAKEMLGRDPRYGRTR